MRLFLQVACWLMLGLGSVCLILVALVLIGYQLGSVSLPLHGGAAVVLLGAGVAGLQVLTRPKDDATGPRLFLMDLITISVVLGVYFSALWDLSEEYNLQKFLFAGGAGLLLSLVLSLLRASRAGLLHGWRRALFSVGCMLATNGLGVLSIFLLVTLSNGYSRTLGMMQATPEGQLFLLVTQGALAGLALGVLFCLVAKARRTMLPPPLPPAAQTTP